MKEQLITFETAKLAKEKGFLEDCEDEYNRDGVLRFNRTPPMYISKYFCNDCLSYFSAPTQSLLQKWLREAHNTHIVVYVFKPEDKPKYCCDIVSEILEEDLTDDQSFDTYEEALEQALYQTLELIK